MKTLLITLSLFSIITAEIIYVPQDYERIQTALNNSQDFDTILVDPGIYYENILFPSNLSLSLICNNEIGECIIDGNQIDRVIRIHSSSEGFSIINGFTIQNG